MTQNYCMLYIGTRLFPADLTPKIGCILFLEKYGIYIYIYIYKTEQYMEASIFTNHFEIWCQFHTCFHISNTLVEYNWFVIEIVSCNSIARSPCKAWKKNTIHSSNHVTQYCSGDRYRAKAVLLIAVLLKSFSCSSFCISWNTIIIWTPNIIANYPSEKCYFKSNSEFFGRRLNYNNMNTRIWYAHQ